jgi:hypothetical protein
MEAYTREKCRFIAIQNLDDSSHADRAGDCDCSVSQRRKGLVAAVAISILSD